MMRKGKLFLMPRKRKTPRFTNKTLHRWTIAHDEMESALMSLDIRAYKRDSKRGTAGMNWTYSGNEEEGYYWNKAHAVESAYINVFGEIEYIKIMHKYQ